MRKLPRAFVAFLVSFVVIIVAASALQLTGHPKAAWDVSYPGSFLMMMACLGYVVFAHSRQRWPGLNWFQRLGYLITFSSPPAQAQPVVALTSSSGRDPKYWN
jgi:hypothetical protein